jgi:putative ABC transport system permease protein
MLRWLFRVSWLENMGFALGAMRAHKLRSLLTLLGVTAGVATVIMMVSFVVGFNEAIRAGFTAFGTTLVQFQKFEPRFGGPGGPPEEQRNRRDLTIEDALALKRLSKLVAAVSPERYKFGDISIRAGRAEANGPIMLGAAPDYMLANNHFVSDGRFFTDADVSHASKVCVIGTDVADALFPNRDAIDEQLTINGRPYQVVGIFEKRGPSSAAATTTLSPSRSAPSTSSSRR